MKKMNKRITIIIKEGNKLYLTFAKEAIRLKMPSFYLTVENRDYWIGIIKKLEPYIYKNFIQTLRASIVLDIVNKEWLKITFKTWDKHKIKKIIIKNNKIKVKEYKLKNETNLHYIKRRIRYAIFS